MTLTLRSASFDYAGLPDATRLNLMSTAQELRQLAVSAAQAMVEIGRRLLWVQEQLGSTDRLREWVRSELTWPIGVVYQYQRIAQAFGDVDWQIADAEPDALRILSQTWVQQTTQDLAKKIMQTGIADEPPRKLTKVEAEILRDQDVSVQNFRGAFRRTVERRGPLSQNSAQMPMVLPSQNDLYELKQAAINLQVALADEYGVPLRGRTTKALSKLQETLARVEASTIEGRAF